VPFEPGETVDRYVIEARLGAGGMGEVYRARDTRLHRRVALKILREEIEANDASASRPSTGGAARMMREARAAAALDHPNVVAVFDVGTIEAPHKLAGATYLAMELIKGTPMRAYVGDARLAMPERVRWLVDVARALGAAHQVGLVHRDVKPENVMIRDDGVVKVLDFGIARRAHGALDAARSTSQGVLLTTTETNAAVGTPIYMAPEQLRAEPLDGRADQFAWGVLAYELLAGAGPWSTDAGLMALISQILSKAPRPLAEAAPDVPAGVVAVVTRALEKDREARFPSMEAVVAELTGAAPLASLAPPPSLPHDPLAPTLLAPSGRASGGPISALASTRATPSATDGAPAATAPVVAARSQRARIGAAAAAVLVLAGIGAATFASRARGPQPPVASASASGSVTAPPAPQCATNKDCVTAHGGEPWICRASDHACVSLKSEDCTVLAEPGDVDVDSTVWLGMMLPLSGELGNTFGMARDAADLARRDFAGTTGHVGAARRIGLVSCNADRDARRAARHLTEDVGVPAVLLGTVDTEGIIDLVTNVFTPREVLSIVPHSASPAVTALPSGPAGRLVFRTTYSQVQPLDVDAALVAQDLEPRWRAHAAGRPMRVAFVHRRDLLFRAFSDRVLSTLRFNGKSAVENGDDFRELSYGDGGDARAAARAALVGFRPDVVILAAAGDFNVVVRPLEEEWPSGAPRPTYAMAFAPYEETWPFIGASAERRRRFLGVDAVVNTIANVDFISHYDETYAQKLNPTMAPNNIYDAFYALAYAIHALGAETVTGPAMARAFRRLERFSVAWIGPL
jgi:serine/threonine protein kinase